MIVGYIDIVFINVNLFICDIEVDGEFFIWGCGIVDMKVGIVV